MADLKYTKGMPNSYLKTAVKNVDASSALINQASKSAVNAKKDPATAQKDLLLAIKQMIADSKQQSIDLNSRTADVILDKISQYLQTINDNLTSDDELEDVKEAIIEEINGSSFSKLLSSMLIAQVSELFDNDAKKEDIEELKASLSELISKSNNEASTASSNEPTTQTQGAEQPTSSTYSDKEVESLDDEKEGEYKDSTVASNFSILQSFIEQQVDQLNENIKKIPGGIGLGRIGKMFSGGFSKMLSATKSLNAKVAKFSKSAFSRISSISKTIGKNAFGKVLKAIDSVKNGISKTIGFVKNFGKGLKTGFGKIGSFVKGLGTKIKSGFSKIGSVVKGFGSKVGGVIASPFKKIGGWFKNRKANAAEKKKEKLREKFMNFTIKMFETLWNFLEPILSKLKVFMIAIMIPIMITAMKVLLIIAAITAIVVGIIMAVMWVKNKLIPKIKAIFAKIKAWTIEKWNSFKKWAAELWEKIKAIGAAVWDFIKYISVGMWVDLGKWLWEKLVQFGKWLKKILIDPVVNWIKDKIVEPIRKFYYSKIYPVIKPFIESIQNLIARIKQAFSAWDTNKSIWENLKNISGIIKQSVMEWWETSPFKKAYDTYIQPVVQSVSDLIQRIKDVWNNFSWDENKSFMENMMGFWENIKTAIKEWWKSSIIKTYWDKLVDWLVNIWNKVKEWWNGTTIGKWINKLQQKIENLKQKLGVVFVHIPGWGGGKNIYPFGPAIGKPFLVDAKDDQEAMNKKRNDEIAEIENRLKTGDFVKAGSAKDLIGWDSDEDLKNKLAKLKAEQQAQEKSQAQPTTAQQQVQNAMAPVNSLNNMNSETNQQLEKTGNEISQKNAEQQAATEDFRQQQSALGSQYLNELRDFREEQRKANKDPAVVPLPMPYGPQRNAAMMNTF